MASGPGKQCQYQKVISRKRTAKWEFQSTTPFAAIRRYVSSQSLSDIVWDSVTRVGEVVGDVLNNLATGTTREEREFAALVEQRKLLLSLRLENALTLREWLEPASELDELDGNDDWKADPHSDEYDYMTVKARLELLEGALLSDDIDSVAYTMRESLDRSVGNITNPRLYTHSRIGTKDIIDRYVTTATQLVSKFLKLIDHTSLSLKESLRVLDQLECTRRSFGRTALLLSGGATFGMHHVGVAKALWETRLLPQVISGSSAGCIVGAVLCASTDKQIPAVLASFGNGNFSVFGSDSAVVDPIQRLRRLFYSGSLFDHAHLMGLMRDLLGDMTFKEAYNRTRRILNICVSTSANHHLPWLLNFVTAPDVVIWSAVGASCAAPWVFSAAPVFVKNPMTGKLSPWSESSHWWIDGSIHSDLPIPALAEMFNATHFIVSQVNPHVIPFIPQGDIYHATDIPQTLYFETRSNYSLAKLAKLEALRRMEFLSSFKPFTAPMKRLAFVMDQHYYGDINILPEVKQDAFPHILNNPTYEFMVRACLAGERATWPRLGRIRNHCAVEYSLETALRILRAKIAIAASSGVPMISHIRPNTSEASELNNIVETLRRRSYEHELSKSRALKRHASSLHLGSGRRLSFAKEESRPDERHAFHVHFANHPSEHVRFPPSVRRRLTVSMFEPQAQARRNGDVEDDARDSFKSTDRQSSSRSKPSSTSNLYVEFSTSPESQSPPPPSSGRRPCVEEESESLSWLCDEPEWPSPLDEDPTASALTFQALVMASQTAPPSPEQENRFRTAYQELY
ncbi:hypothetical protein VTO42DRAFT_2703 [Malbranchea cinnamomea]